ncbi:MAG: hypothetical protein IKN73_04145 [Alphaproteobacteria bacterium]|nr:hypothetical protein [Alphaproteobacteria bacterium]
MSFRLYQNFNNSIPFLQGYKQLKIPIIDNAGNPAWPELFPMEKIQEIENSVGPRHFSAQMMLEYVSEDRIHLDPGALHFYDDDFDDKLCRIGEHNITSGSMYWDPSSGHMSADGSVCVLIYRDDKNKRMFLHDMMHMKVDDEDNHPLSTQCEYVLNFMHKHKFNRIGIEINGIGNALPEILRKTAETQNIKINVIQISNHIKKETRILNAIEPILNTGHLFVHERIKQTMLLSEMLSWTPMGSSEHDDGLDALAGALVMNPNIIKPLSNRVGFIKANTDFQI